jgi:hypothetical protein
MQATTATNKQHFLRYTYAVESISAAMKTRNPKFPVYERECTENKKAGFKTMLLKHVLGLWIDKNVLDENTMLTEIERLKKICEQYKHILYNEKMRIGICQKMICLYAKFLWVSGQLTSPPPLIPYDGVVKGLLKDSSLPDWTVLDDMVEYKKIIAAIQNVSGGQPAEWELQEWNRMVYKNLA